MIDENYHLVCWLTLKAAKPRLSKLMTEIELKIAGISVKHKTPTQLTNNPLAGALGKKDDGKKITPV